MGDVSRVHQPGARNLKQQYTTITTANSELGAAMARGCHSGSVQRNCATVRLHVRSATSSNQPQTTPLCQRTSTTTHHVPYTEAALD